MEHAYDLLAFLDTEPAQWRRGSRFRRRRRRRVAVQRRAADTQSVAGAADRQLGWQVGEHVHHGFSKVGCAMPTSSDSFFWRASRPLATWSSLLALASWLSRSWLRRSLASR